MVGHVLGIETSCDETAVAIVRDGVEVRASIVATQHELHERYAGIVPEIASRAHLERLVPVIEEAVSHAGVTLRDLDAVAVGHRPGLIGSLVVGVAAAKALAWSLDRPLVGVDHLLAHLYAPRLDDEPIAYPALGLVVSGGHTVLVRLEGPLAVERLGGTIDDAVGEAFDKAAVILQLGWPGGPVIDRLAASGDDSAHDLPVATLDEAMDFSFSGLKTALLYAVRGRPVGRGAGARHPRNATDLTDTQRADFAASFQRAAVEALRRGVTCALDRFPVCTLVVGGGVSANSCLRTTCAVLADEAGIPLRLPPPRFCLDNAAMIAGLAAVHLAHGETANWHLAAAAR